MLDHSESPPPLHHSPAPSDQSGFPSRDSTPVTPIGPGPPAGKRPDKDRDHLPWFKKPIDVGRTTTRLCLDTTLLEPDFDDHSFPLFGAPPPDQGMATTATPINIRQTSTSPRGSQPSNLTSALQRSNSGENRNMHSVDLDGMERPQAVKAEASTDIPTRLDSGAKPISMKGVFGDKNRRESIAQSLGTGMSWGGISVGSWIRDDIVMEGTSPFAFQSPSFHSSSYLPKLEANFMRDFSCCGETLPTLHDLLQHYEEAHAQKPIEGSQIGGTQPPLPDARAAIATNTAVAVQQHAEQQRLKEQQGNVRSVAPSQTPQQSTVMPHRASAFTNTLQTIPDMDTVDDMDMDMDDIGTSNETTPPPNFYTQNHSSQSPQLQFASTAQPQIPQLNTNMMQGHQAYRNSTPSTPIVSGRPGAAFQNNQSGINTPTLMNNPMQQQFQDLQNQHRTTPESSAPGTPGEIEESLLGGMDGMSMQGSQLYQNQNGIGGFGGFGMNNDMIDLYIDEPAKRLFTPGGFGNQNQQQQYTHNRLGSGQYGPNSDIAKRIREQQMLAGLPDTTVGMMPHEEPKPFRCPVIGCEKAYKNQNGLKYHKSHGHNNQRLHDNADGTYSIVNPDTQAPYPGTQGMEKEKPYKCDVCQKRYKNLNGLKYHKTHSPPCNPELQLNRQSSSGLAGMLSGQGQGMSNLGAGLSGGMLS